MHAWCSTKRRHREARIIRECQFGNVFAVVPGLLNGVFKKGVAGFFDCGKAGRKRLERPFPDSTECRPDLDHLSGIGCGENETIHFKRIFRWASISSRMPRRPRPSNSDSASGPKGSRSAVP